ncbi:oligosaccharyl transferase, archaeosortase A system-associated [Halobacteriales archaeon QS_3_64_16]|nr:MAG: oligosaccharyl transferase, archaeosortase A system-associated [Halobacteriales archaeon QS_3_64_16]
MSQRREQGSERLPASEAVLDRIEAWYHVPVLAALLAFMAWIRVRNWRAFVVDGRVLFSGNDAWYHYRQVSYSVRNWPATMPFDPWTNFPTGTTVGQFGTLFDQIIATVALLIGLGSPSEQTISLTLLFAPAAFGVLTAIPVYFIGKRLGGRLGGVIGVAILALSPSSFLRRSLVGFSDHHIAEAFLQAFAVLAVLIALSIANREKPVYEQLVDRDFDGLRRPAGWATLAGVAIALYIWAWPPAVFLVGILGAYFTIALTAEYLAGNSPEHLAFVGAVALSVTGVLAIVPLNLFTFSPTNFSLLQPLLAFAVAAGCVFMAWLARLWDGRDLPRSGYPVAISGGLVVLAGLLAVLAPDLAALIRSQFLRVAGFGTSATAQTVGEAQPIPLDQVGSYFSFYYGLAYITAAAAILLMGWRIVRGSDDRRAEYLFVITWTIFLLAATLTQVRFNYYLTLAVAVLNAFLIGWVVRLVDADPAGSGASDTRSGRARSRLGNLQTYQVLAVVAALLLVTAPLAVRGQSPTAGEYADSSATPGEVTNWEGSLEWLRENTPQEGTYGGATNDMAYYGSFERTGDFDYPPGAYGVMSWWDYGHYITSIGQRIPVANPFQQGATNAANFLLATNETRANSLLPADQGGQNTRYVMIDWKLADPSSGKFTAPIVFYDDNGSLAEADVLTRLYDQQGQRQIATIKRQRYYESLRVRLYKFHGSSASPQPIAIDYSREQTASSSGLGEVRYALVPQSENGSGQVVRQFENMSAARAFVERERSAQIGGVQGIPSEYVSALEHYRLVHASEDTASQTGTPWVKTFERVPGAQVEGSGPPNSRVTASVELRMPNADETFTYTQRARTDSQGQFTMTVPYSTTNYARWGTEEGYTNVSVQATGPYTFTAGGPNATVGPSAGGANATGANATAADGTIQRATAPIPEGAVIGERNASIQVTLEEQPRNASSAAGSGSNSSASAAGTNATSGNASSGANASTGANASNGSQGAIGSSPVTTASNVPDRARRSSAAPTALRARLAGLGTLERVAVGGR